MGFLVKNAEKSVVHLGQLFLLSQPDWVLYLWRICLLVLDYRVQVIHVWICTRLKRMNPVGMPWDWVILSIILGPVHFGLTVHFMILSFEAWYFAFEILYFLVLDWDVPELFKHLGLFVRARSLECEWFVNRVPWHIFSLHFLFFKNAVFLMGVQFFSFFILLKGFRLFDIRELWRHFQLKPAHQCHLRLFFIFFKD